MRNKSKPDRGLNSECKKCTIELSRKYRKDHLGERVEYDKKYRTINKVKEYSRYRSQHKKHKITKQEWEMCKKYFNYECAYCGLPLSEHYYTRNGITKNGDFHKEHVDHEGNNGLSNCVPSCGSCNSSKWKSELNEWYNINNPKYSEERYNKIMQWLNGDWVLYSDNLDIENLDLVHNQSL